MTSGDLLPALGTTLAGKYRLTRKLGQGGMGAVYEATHLRLGQRVAIKVVLPEVAARPELAYRFEHEARAAARLRGPHSARVYDVDTSPEGLPYLVMEYLEGHSLRDELRKRGPLPVDEAVRFVRQACEGVDEAHRAGIVHRDIKPANLFLSVEGERRLVKVVDFGIAKLSDAGPADYRTATSAPLGTYLYMSPEQVRSPRSVDARSDIWSLGVTLYQLVSGKLPFQGEGALGVVYAVSTQDPPPLRALRPELPAALVAVVERALCKEPAGRFQTVRELADALAPFDPARAPLPSAPEAPSPPRPSNTDALSESTTTGAKSHVVPPRPAESSGGTLSRGLWLAIVTVGLFVGGSLTVGLRAARLHYDAAPDLHATSPDEAPNAGASARSGVPLAASSAPLAASLEPAPPSPSAPAPARGAPRELGAGASTATTNEAKAPAEAPSAPASARPVSPSRRGKAPVAPAAAEPAAHATAPGAPKAAAPAAAPEPAKPTERSDVERFLGTRA